jgi:hypothetical protein
MYRRIALGAFLRTSAGSGGCYTYAEAGSKPRLEQTARVIEETALGDVAGFSELAKTPS